MKNTFLKTIGTAALAILMLVMFAQISAFAQEIVEEEQIEEQTPEGIFQPVRNRQTLEGSWDVQTTRVNCQTGAVLGTSPAMFTFMRGGTTVSIGVGIPRGPGHGVWEFESGRRYTSAFQFFRFNADGTLSGRQIIRQQITLSSDGNSFTSSATAQVLDTGGNVTANNCNTATGIRFE